MKRHPLVLICTVLTLLCITTISAADDPRPHVLIIGGINTQPFGAAPSWAQHLQVSQPQWHVTVDATKDRSFGTLDQQIDDLLTQHGQQQMVVLVPDVHDAATEAYAERDAAAVGQAIEKTLDQIARHANTKAATVVLATPFPVVDDRLDKWQKKAYDGGQQRSLAIAEQIQQIGTQRELTVLPLTQFVLEKKDGAGKPGLPMGSLGARLRDWGHTLMAKEFFIPQMSKLAPQAADPQAFAAWQRARQQMVELAELLHKTSTGEVRRGGALRVEVTGKKSEKATVTIPASALTGKTLDLLILPPDGGAIGFDFHMVFNQDRRPTLTVGEQRLPMDPGDWRLIDESRPREVIPHIEHGLNAGKWRPYGAVWDLPDKRRWMLLRISLDQLTERADGTIGFDLATPGESMTPQGPTAFQPPVPWNRAPQFFLVASPDDRWQPGTATWTSSDGQVGWTGGQVDLPARTAALKTFLQGDLEPTVRQAAKQELSHLEP